MKITYKSQTAAELQGTQLLGEESTISVGKDALKQGRHFCTECLRVLTKQAQKEKT